MKMFKSKTWQFEKIGTEKDCELFGVQIFELDLKSTGEHVTVKSPDFQSERTANIVEVIIDGHTKRLAMDELSNGVYGFYLYKY